jgi:hypothetical protein
MLVLMLTLWTAEAEACGSQRHYLGGFVAFDAAGGWWAWDGLTHTDVEVVGDKLSDFNSAFLVRYDSQGVPVEVREAPKEALESAYLAQPYVGQSDRGDHAIDVREAMDEAALKALVPLMLADRTLLVAVPMTDPVAVFELPPLERPCEAQLMLLKTPDGRRQSVHRVEGYEASPGTDSDAEWGHGVVITDQPVIQLHPDGSFAVVEMMWGVRGRAHGASRSAHVVLPLGPCQEESCSPAPLDGGSCDLERSAAFDGQSKAAWLQVAHVADDDVLYLRDRPTSRGEELGSLPPDQGCLWGYLPREGQERAWAWLPGRGWAHGYYLVEDVSGTCPGE